jgi:hypothetical protein
LQSRESGDSAKGNLVIYGFTVYDIKSCHAESQSLFLACHGDSPRGSRATYGLYRIWASCLVTLQDFLAALLRSYFRVIRRPSKLQLGSLQDTGEAYTLQQNRNNNS